MTPEPTKPSALDIEEVCVPESVEFEVYCDDELVASVYGPREWALIEARRYAALNAEDGEVYIMEVTRRLLDDMAPDKQDAALSDLEPTIHSGEKE